MCQALFIRQKALDNSPAFFSTIFQSAVTQDNELNLLTKMDMNKEN